MDTRNPNSQETRRAENATIALMNKLREFENPHISDKIRETYSLSDCLKKAEYVKVGSGQGIAETGELIKSLCSDDLKRACIIKNSTDIYQIDGPKILIETPMYQMISKRKALKLLEISNKSWFCDNTCNRCTYLEHSGCQDYHN